MTRHTLIFGALLLTSIWMGIAVSGADLKQDRNQEIRTLQVQKRATLQQNLDMLVEAHRAATTTSIDEVIAARNTFLEAEFDLAENQQQEVAIRKQQLDNYRMLEKVAEQRFRTGATAPGDRLIAIATRIEAEIEYLRAQE